MRYDWSGARTRRVRLMRLTSAVILLLLFVVSASLLMRQLKQRASVRRLPVFSMYIRIRL